MTYDFTKFKKKVADTEEWFKSESALLRTGRATPALIENIKVDCYGGKSPLKGVASISVEDARTLIVKPWESDSALQVEQAVRSSDLGVQAISEKGFVRVIFPELTEERRRALLKILGEKLEESKVSVRVVREEIWRDVQEKERKGEISEDDKFRYKDELQKMVDDFNKKLKDISDKKEAEIKG